MPDRLRSAGSRAVRLVRRLMRAPRREAAILMYHRIGSPPWDPFGLAVSAANFERQLDTLMRHRTLVSMDGLARGLADGDLPPRATAITFDDGYRDNVEVAGPLLAARGIPATIFLATGRLGAGPFWWDELADLVLGHDAACDVAVTAAAEQLRLVWPARPCGAPGRDPWRFGKRPRGPRQAAYARIWRVLSSLDPPARDSAMDRLRAALSASRAAHAGRPMAYGEPALAPSVLTFGAHGVSHTPLPGLPPTARRNELRESLETVRTVAPAHHTRGFAYPHGEHDADTRALLRDLGCPWAVTTRPALVKPETHDPLALPRIHVGDWSGTRLLAAIGGAAS